MRRLGIFGLLRLLVKALQLHAAQQARIADQLAILNRHVARIWPVAPDLRPDTPPVPDLGFPDDDYTLSNAEDARAQLAQELLREPSTEEILERMQLWRERRQPELTRDQSLLKDLAARAVGDPRG